MDQIWIQTPSFNTSGAAWKKKEAVPRIPKALALAGGYLLDAVSLPNRKEVSDQRNSDSQILREYAIPRGPYRWFGIPTSLFAQ